MAQNVKEGENEEKRERGRGGRQSVSQRSAPELGQNLFFVCLAGSCVVAVAAVIPFLTLCSMMSLKRNHLVRQLSNSQFSHLTSQPLFRLNPASKFIISSFSLSHSLLICLQAAASKSLRVREERVFESFLPLVPAPDLCEQDLDINCIRTSRGVRLLKRVQRQIDPCFCSSLSSCDKFCQFCSRLHQIQQ